MNGEDQLTNPTTPYSVLDSVPKFPDPDEWDYYLNSNGSVYAPLTSYNTSNEMDASTENSGFPGEKIVAGSITADQISSKYIYGGVIEGKNILADSDITIGTGNNVVILSGSDGTYRIWVGNASAVSAPFRVTQGGALTATNASISGTITSSNIIMDQSSSGGGGTTNSYFRWSGGSKIWSDSANNMGYNAIAGTMIFYGNNNEIFQSNISSLDGITNEIAVSGRINCKGLYLNQGQDEGSIRKVDIIRGFNDLRFWTGDGDTSDDYKFLNDAGNGNVFRIEHNTGYAHSLSSYLDLATNILHFTGGSAWTLNGNSKTAIVPTKDGYRALYSMESPEVWFMDFCPGKKVRRKWWKFWDWTWSATPDPMFLEVTEPPYVIMPTAVKGLVQVWAKRKGHPERFEKKTKAEFEKNEAFLKMAKVK